MDIKSQFDITLKILCADTRSLRDLASLSERDSFTFYQGADLSGLDLAGQDLTGLNFDRADLRDSDLSNVSFDLGAFNGSELSKQFEDLKDEFDCFLEDALDDRITSGVYVFASFREHTLERAIKDAGFYYEQLAERSNLGLGTIRKARRSGVVALDTATAIARSILERLGTDQPQSLTPFSRIAAQPMIRFLELMPSGGFRHIPRPRILELAETSARVDARRYPNGKPYLWRRGPQTLNWLDFRPGDQNYLFGEED